MAHAPLPAVYPTPVVASGTYVYPFSSHTQSTSGGLGNATLRLSPVYLPAALTVTRLGGEISGAGDAGCTVRLGIYSDSGAGMPAGLLLDAGTIPGDSTGSKEVTLASSFTVPAGWTWWGGVVQGVTTTQPTVRCNTTLPWGFLIQLNGTPTAGQAVCGYYMAGVTGALPATFTLANTIGVGPRVFAKAA